MTFNNYNFQARDLDIQAMVEGCGWYWENLWTHTYRQPIYKSDLSKGLKIMRCSNKVPKSVTHALHVEGRTALILVCRFTYEPPHDKTNKWHVRPAKTQISLGIRPSDQSRRCALNR